MTEKRFMTNEVGCIVDLYDNQLRNYDGQEIVDLLNKLNENFETLKFECKHQCNQKHNLITYLRRKGYEMEEIREIANGMMWND